MRSFTSFIASVLLFVTFAWAQSTITSTRTVVHMVTETHYHSTEVLNVTSTIVSVETPVMTPAMTPVVTPSAGFHIAYSMNGTATATPTPAGASAMTSLAKAIASGSAASAKPSSGAAAPLRMDAALAAIVAGVGYMVL